MGLDMYLNAKRFLWHSEESLSEKVSEVFPELKGKQVKEVVVQALYWRKCNQIHKWFVDNVQSGTDNCGNYYVSREDLETLRQLILEALANKNSSLLPPQSGFFFGSDTVDQYYWEDLRYTEEKLGRVLDEFPEGWEFEYHSSW
jgi:hypothetical protein